MKICYLFSNYHLVNITAEPKMAIALAEHALRNSHEVYIISNYTKNKTEKRGKIRFFLFKGLGDLKTYLLNTPHIIRHLTKVKPNIIHVHGGIIIVYVLLINLFLRIPLVFTLCEGLDTFGSFQKKLLVFCLSRMKAIFVTSSYLKNQLVAQGVARKKIKVVRLGLEKKFLTAKPLKQTNADVFFFGDSSYERGFDIVYALAKKIQNVSFTVLIRWKKDCVKELQGINSLPNVRMYHSPYKEPLINMILKSKIILLPFRWMGVRPPLSIIESMALGKCVFTSTMEGNEELIRNNENGVLFDFTNINAVAKQICSLIESPSQLRKIGESARKTIETMYSDKECTKIIDYYAFTKS
jgi:glycosyltransferase involved in cell wall biosynthesis